MQQTSFEFKFELSVVYCLSALGVYSMLASDGHISAHLLFNIFF